MAGGSHLGGKELNECVRSDELCAVHKPSARQVVPRLADGLRRGGRHLHCEWVSVSSGLPGRAGQQRRERRREARREVVHDRAWRAGQSGRVRRAGQGGR
eukprot:scaffold117406_cov64-Phaeocystis_antarctica.AAC.2